MEIGIGNIKNLTEMLESFFVKLYYVPLKFVINVGIHV